MQVKEIMSSPVHVVREDATLEAAAKRMIEHRISGLPVVDAEGKACGFITESDFAAKERSVPFALFQAPEVLGEWLGKDGVERVYARARSKLVRDVMCARVYWVSPEAAVDEAIATMAREDVNRVLVLEDGRPVGIVSRHDLLRLMARGGQPTAGS